MTYRGRVQNGVVVPEDVPEGAEVRIDVQAPADASGATAANGNLPAPNSMYERYQNIIGVLDNLPADASERVDEFLYGTPNP